MSETLKTDAWVATALGDPTKVLERQIIEVRAPGPGEVRVEVSTFCVNFNDTDIVRGRWSVVPLVPPFTPGMEAMGVVESAGPGSEYLVGRRIVGIPVGAHGGFAEYALVDATSAMLIPSWLTDAQGAALHYPFHLGWFSLVERAKLQAGETLLVRGGSGEGRVLPRTRGGRRHRLHGWGIRRGGRRGHVRRGSRCRAGLGRRFGD